MNAIDLDTLDEAQLEQLEQRLAAKRQAEKQRRDNEMHNYKELVKRTVNEQMISIQEVNSMLSIAKAQVFGSLTTLIAIKHELFGIKSGQQSHSFSDDNGNTVTVGYRVIDKFDDTLDAGIAMVNRFIEAQATDDKSAKLVAGLNKLLKKDAKGNLKANRVVELQNWAEDINDETLTQGVEIIRKSYRPVRSAIFVEAETADESGKKQSVGLSITSVDFPDGFEPNFDVFK